MNDSLIKKAQERAYRDIYKNKEVKVMPKPRTLTEVSVERNEERKFELIAPKTGYPDLDLIIKGFIPGHLYTLTGMENVGKTSLACNFADRIRRQDKRVLYFALEPENLVVDYLASVRLDKMFSDLTPKDVEFDDGFIHVYGKQEVPTAQDLVDIVRDSEHYDVIFIDHIGYFVKDLRNTNQEQSNIVKLLAGLCKERQTAIVQIAHLRKRAPNQRGNYRPTSDDISGSGAFKQDSTEVMIVIRETDPNDTENLTFSMHGKLYVTKTKSGPNGWVPLVFSERKANIMSLGEIAEIEVQKNRQNRLDFDLEIPADKDIY
jgi:replicative DNA helicase